MTTGLGLPEELVQLLPLGYVRRFGGRRATLTPELPLRLAYWGNITHRKGVQVLLRAARTLDDSQPLTGRVELHVFGGIDTDELAAELRELATGLPVHFRGRYEHDELADLDTHLAVFPSTCFETYGFVLDEAFELGVPALVTDVGAFAERLQGAGWLVPPGDVNALAAVLASVLDAPQELAARAARIPPASPAPLEHAELLLEHYRHAHVSLPRVGEAVLGEQRNRLAEIRGKGERDGPPGKRGL